MDQIVEKLSPQLVIADGGTMGCKKPTIWIKYNGNRYKKIATFVSEKRMNDFMKMIENKWIEIAND